MTTTPHRPSAGREVEPGTPLAFTDPAGRRRVTTARIGPERLRDPSLPHLVGPVLLGEGRQRCLRVRPVPERASDSATRALLDTEIRAALGLHGALAGTEHAALFPEPLGHETDTGEPFLLYAPPRGTLLSVTRVMSATDQRALARGLVSALCVLEDLSLVLRGISPATVFWDGSSVQLWGLEGAETVGRPRSPWGRKPYRSPEQGAGRGLVEVGDMVWSAARVLYRMASGRPGPPDGPPPDLAEYRVLDGMLRGAFAPLAADRPTPTELLDRLFPGAGRRPVRPPGDGGAPHPHRQAFEETLRLKRRVASTSPPRPPEGEDGGAPGESTGEVLCPHCLRTIRFDPHALFVTDSRKQYQPLDPAELDNVLSREDILRGAVQRCSADPRSPEHFIAVPHLVHGRPLTVAMVGASASGKSHLLTRIIAEIIDGGLEPHGLTWRSVNPEQHARFVRDRVQPLRAGRVLGHTETMNGFARFEEALLITDAGGRTRPVAFFDLAGEDLVRTDGALRFLLGVDAMIFVVDPLSALPLPHLDHLRKPMNLEVNPNGDPAFATVLDRLPRNGPYSDITAAMVVGKADLLRFHPPVDRWWAEPEPTGLDPDLIREESGDVYGFLRRHAGQAWLSPFDTIRRCTLHVASATGARDDAGRYPAGAEARRVLGPLVSLLAMNGLIPLPSGADVLGGGTEPAGGGEPR
ncbi:hypothetical protein [Streptomyces sp. ST2-7A]|uniref:hypothetical protein n=1 Tax=Streptomyces sp. ST2-7A TaxID=2907214 RepID=UPI001F38B805|nr:hypothetical protein [Streptomyces sp. ST2-7A]MCE7082175.1 hypothetical protein [Streptomyces sp. ST2-7A]